MSLAGDVYLFPPPLYMSLPVFIRVLPLHQNVWLLIYVLSPAQPRSCLSFSFFSVYNLSLSSIVLFNCNIPSQDVFSIHSCGSRNSPLHHPRSNPRPSPRLHRNLVRQLPRRRGSQHRSLGLLERRALQRRARNLPRSGNQLSNNSRLLPPHRP